MAVPMPTDSSSSASSRAPRLPLDAASATSTSSRGKSGGTSKLPPTFKKNPFSRKGERENFPSLDECFQSIPREQASDAGGSEHWDGDTSSVLNMSIGARAALNEHLRFVARHGLEGERTSDDSHASPSNPLDAQWDYLLDQSALASSLETSTDVSFPRQLFHGRNHGLDHSDVLTDVSQDFFNSSRVQALATPERHHKPRNHVVTRDDDASGILEDDDLSGPMLAPVVFHPPGSVEGSQEASTSTSFPMGFDAPDISRISSADESDALHHARSPESSFTPRIPMDDPQFSPIPKEGPSSPASLVKRLDASFASAFLPAPPTNERLRLPPLVHRSHSEPITAIDKENNRSNTELPTALDTLPKQLLRAIETTPTRDGGSWSPISHSGSSLFASNHQSSSSSSRRRRMQEHLTLANLDQSITNHSSDENSSLTGRKRFRTVVPRRVYLNSPSQFSEEQDSFGTVPRNSSEQPTPRSLGDSFDAVAEPKHGNYDF